MQDWYNFCSFASKVRRKHLTSQALKAFSIERLPIIKWLPQYTRAKAWADVQAGIVVGCMLIPQGMGYADVAGLPVVAGLYSGFAPLLVYSVLGTSRQMGVGPVAIVSLLISTGMPACSQLCPNNDGSMPHDPYPMCKVKCDRPMVYNDMYWTYATICAMMVGIIQSVAAPLLGFIMNFVPHPVISGFTSAAGCIIAMSQLKDVMGYSIRKDRLQEGIEDFFASMGKTHVPTFLMGTSGITFLIFVRYLALGKIFCWTPRSGIHRYIRLAAKLPWAFILVVVYTAAVYSLDLDKLGVKITGKVPSGMPNFRFPPNFIESFPKLISITIQIIIIGYLESIAVETKFATMFGYQINPTQEGLALGLANVIGGFTFAYPVVGSFSRSAVNASYKSQSPLCNLVTGIVIMFTLLALTPLFTYMPKNVLAAIVIVAAVSLIDFHEPIFLWRSSKKEFLLLVITFGLTAFVALELGIYVAVSLCGVEVLFKSTRPKVLRLSDKVLLVYLPGAAGLGKDQITDAMQLPRHLNDVDILVCRVEGDLTFSSSSSLRNIISHHFIATLEQRPLSALVFDFQQLEIIDTTALSALIALVEEIETRHTAVFIVGVPKSLVKFLKMPRIKEKLKGVGIMDDILEVKIPSKEGSFHEPDDVERVRLVDSDPAGRLPDFSKRSARYQMTLENAVDAAIRQDGQIKMSRQSMEIELSQGPDIFKC